MKRRRFLQLAASTAAATLVQHSSALHLSAQPAAADVLSLTVGEPPWAIDVSHAGFIAGRRPAIEPDQLIAMLLEKKSGGTYQWIVDGRPQAAEALLLQKDRRYRLRMMNATGRVHTARLQHHRFELARIHQVQVSGIFKDTLRLERYSVVEADVLISRSGPLLLQCPQALD